MSNLAAALLLIAGVNTDCDTAELIQKAKCGQVVPPGQGEALAGAIIHFLKNQEQRKIAGNNGWKYFMDNFERRQVVGKYIQLVSKSWKDSASVKE